MLKAFSSQSQSLCPWPWPSDFGLDYIARSYVYFASLGIVRRYWIQGQILCQQCNCIHYALFVANYCVRLHPTWTRNPYVQDFFSSNEIRFRGKDDWLLWNQHFTATAAICLITEAREAGGGGGAAGARATPTLIEGGQCPPPQHWCSDIGCCPYLLVQFNVSGA